MGDIEQTTVIDPTQVGRMASSRTDGRSTTLYGRHRKGAGKPHARRGRNVRRSRSWRLL